MENHSIVFGPVPSRRLGSSLGVNNVYPKTCTYSCIYCQLGPTIKILTERRVFYPPEKIIEQVSWFVSRAEDEGVRIDYVTFVPDGEPTLDLKLGEEINGIKRMGLKVAVITNSSLLWDQQVRNDILEADWVSLKVDAVSVKVWRKINRPARTLKLELIMDGIRKFSGEYDGFLATETMLVDGVSSLEEIRGVSSFLSEINPDKAYISIPTRPPAEPWVRPPSSTFIAKAYGIFLSTGLNTGMLTGFEGKSFKSLGKTEDDILAIASVHPLRKDALEELLKTAGINWNVITRLVSEGYIEEIRYGSHTYYRTNLWKLSKRKY